VRRENEVNRSKNTSGQSHQCLLQKLCIRD